MALVAAGFALGTAAFKFFQGRAQAGRAREIRENATDPGFMRNQGMIDNMNILRDRYTNYQMPGYGQAQQGINLAANTAFTQGSQGATSGADVMDLATRTQYGRQQGLNQLAMTSAQAREQALMQYLASQEAVGTDAVRVNQLENQRYDQQMMEAAALEQAGVTNQYGAVNELGAGLSQAASSYFSPQWTFDSQGRMIQDASRFNQWLSNRRNRRTTSGGSEGALSDSRYFL